MTWIHLDPPETDELTWCCFATGKPSPHQLEAEERGEKGSLKVGANATSMY